jgi:hypothetical protein
MTYNKAKELLATAPRGNIPSRVNPSLTQAQVVGIIERGITEESFEYGSLHDMFQKRVWQCVKNQRRPRYQYTKAGED